MLPGFCFSCGLPFISALKHFRLQHGGKARFLLPKISFRKFQLFSAYFRF